MILKKLTAKFVVGFCKVQFLCYEGTPNWLGYIVLGIGTILFTIFTFLILAVIQMVVMRHEEARLDRENYPRKPIDKSDGGW